MAKLTFDEAYKMLQDKTDAVCDQIAKYRASGNDVRRNKYEYRLSGLMVVKALLDGIQWYAKDAGVEDVIGATHDKDVFISNFKRVCGIVENKNKVVLTPDTDLIELMFERGWDVHKIIKRCKEQGDVMYDEKARKIVPLQ